ncbi:hypothetical protein [Rubrivivax benzoatilyticus]|uniref:Uncharacterized protein n=1 Tax=Rubrivivax benzoatilyticus TaxID=316997 RepID=A0ABX0I4N9_9BURK|nr:hypothetical protein [Rubrivivax benzoatilyticus]NHL00501.1 hypothetical protein [Rubrivivax benzoatilyticus]NHL26366.1 hypothetical protein [Rubrivivax benzoatilyticus]
MLPLPLAHELCWAQYWLAGQAGRINAFRNTAAKIQRLVLINDIGEALCQLDIYVHSAGWSLWAVELRAALLQLSEGTAAQRAWLGGLQSKTVNSIPGLLFEVFGDRNDDTFSYDAIYGKCMNSFPRFESVAPWLVDYLKFRALSHIENPEKALPAILSRDITSSLIDYYEDVVEALACVEGDSSLLDIRPAASKLVSTLLEAGFTDHRLKKLHIALSATEFSTETPIATHPTEDYCSVYLGSTQAPANASLAGISGDLLQCQNHGAASYELVGKLLKWGLNLRGLDVGPAVALSALQSTSSIQDQRVLPFSAILLAESLCLDDIAALSAEKGLELLRAYLFQRGKHVAKDQLLRPRSWDYREVLPNPGPLHLWLARQLLDADSFDELAEVTEFLRSRGPFWERQCAKLDAISLIKQRRLDEAIGRLEVWFRKDFRYALEFPGEALFSSHKWADFKALDPIEVGLVAHYEFETKGAANVGYICKMACRKFLQDGLRQSVIEEYSSSSDSRRAQLVAFLRDVWIEQNLAMCHQYESTAQVRVERMTVLQLLLSWEDSRAVEYAEAIKDLTFDQTLQRGLERIDQTRVFVNESAISRWAEKELEQDYERWRRLSESSSGGRTVDDMLRQYALDPTNVEVLKEFANGRPTAADALLIDIVDRLFKRFLLDPTDGLDTYLSVRVRHGSLRGTILGPLEEQGLLYSTTGSSEQAFEARWDDVLRLPPAEKARLLAMMREFSEDIRKLVTSFVEQRVQVQRPEKPDGAFPQVLPPLFAKLIAASLAERPVSFHAFLCAGYFVFWKLIEAGLSGLRAYVSEDLADSLHSRVERLMQELRSMGQRYLPLITTLTTAATMTKSQCDTVAEWFQLPSLVGGERYQLPDAIEIASVATRNVHRSFPANVQIVSLPATSLPLTTSALAVLMDCLFVVFENAWKHSGLAADLPNIQLLAEYDPSMRLLTLTTLSALSPKRRSELLDGELSRLRSKYLGELPLELISLEGGSGFPKLARMSRSVAREACAQPFDFGIEDEYWYTRVTVPLYEREGAFEAYE